jgi:hypothetical protein
MNKSFYAFGMLMLITFSQAVAQKNETALITKSSIFNSKIGADGVVATNIDVSALAIEKFRKDFRDAKDVEWKEIKDGYRAYFIQGDILTAVDYNRKGKLFSTIRYGKKLLTGDMMEMLESRFTDPQLREVSEVKIADFATKVYIIVLEDDISMKTVQVMEDEVKVISELRK